MDAYRHDLPLVIDPSLIAATLLGGDGYDEVRKVLVDKTGNIVVAGNTAVPSSGQSFPTVGGGFAPTIKGSAGTYDVFVARFDPQLQQMLNMTFLGSWANDYVNGLKMAQDGSFWLAGYTAYNPDFPTTAGAYQRSGPRNSGGYVTHLSSSLSTLIASTVFDVRPWTHNEFSDLALDNSGSMFASGLADGGGLPDRAGFDPTHNGWSDAIVVKFSGNLNRPGIGRRLRASY